MIERKKRLKFIQFSLVFVGIIIILYTYTNRERDSSEKILPLETQEKIKKQLGQNSENGEVFYNIEYSGIDLSGNRYILKSGEATNNKLEQDVVNLKTVEAFFYFKDDTVLKVRSDKGIYNNKTLDMYFDGNVKAEYEESELFAKKAEYSNSKSFLKISENVKIIDTRGTMIADNLLFDIKNLAKYKPFWNDLRNIKAFPIFIKYYLLK